MPSNRAPSGPRRRIRLEERMISPRIALNPAKLGRRAHPAPGRAAPSRRRRRRRDERGQGSAAPSLSRPLRETQGKNFSGRAQNRKVLFYQYLTCASPIESKARQGSGREARKRSDRRLVSACFLAIIVTIRLDRESRPFGQHRDRRFGGSKPRSMEKRTGHRRVKRRETCSMKVSARQFLTIYLPALLILGLSAHAEDRTIARAPLPPLPTSSAETQSGPGSAPAQTPPRDDAEPPAAGAASPQVSDRGHNALHPERPANDRHKSGMASRRKDVQAERAKRHRQPAEPPPEGAHGRAAAADHGILSPPRQVSPPRPEYGARGGRAPEPSPNDIASAEDSPTGGLGYVPHPAYQRRFTYPWPFGSPQAGGFVLAPPSAPPPPFGYYPNYPPPCFSNATPYRFP